jgi:hypothetical protein
MREEYAKQFEQFNRDVARHSVTVLRDDGLYRHLRCSAGSYCMQFDLITWPGHLCYAGDMGCFVFARLPDMFEFFRGRRTAMVDRGYLAEKAIAADKSDGVRVYSEDLFHEAVKCDFDQFVENHDLTPEHADGLWAEIESGVLSRAAEQYDAVEAALNFRWLDHPRGRDVFPDFWEHRLEDYTARFWWCCYAIPWAIEQHDAMKCSAGPAAADGGRGR